MTPALARLKALIAAQRRLQRQRLAIAAVAAGLATGSGVLLLGLSGWFITGAALAGLAGAGAAQTFNVLLPSAAIRLLAVLRTGGRYVERVSGHEAALKALAALRPILFEDMASAPPEKALALSSGEASARFVQDVDALQTLFVRLSGTWGALAGALAATGLAALAGPKAAAVVAVSLVVSVAGAVVIGRRHVDTAGCQTQIAVGALKDRLSALHASAAELKAYGLEDWAVVEVERSARSLDEATARASTGAGWMSVWQTLVMGGSVTGLLAVSRGVPAAQTALAALAAIGSIEAASAWTTHLRSDGAARQAIRRLSDLLAGRSSSPRDVMRFGEAARLGIRSIGLALSPPRRLAIVGATGSGKTTLIERLMGLRHFADPSLTVGGAAAFEEESHWLRAQFAYAAQDLRFLAGTVRSNLLVADAHADDTALWLALDDADLAARVRQSPQGLDLPLGENGAGLSGGERRRLGLARAFLRTAPWLVLDEPTEGLDAACEARVMGGLGRRLARTCQGLIVISHRSVPREFCDTVIGVDGIDADGHLRLTEIVGRSAAA